MMIKNFDFEFAIDPEDVGMRTGATIHTMNGLQMRVHPASEVDSNSGWWEMEHIKRGLNANGRPYASEEDAAWQTYSKKDFDLKNLS